VPLPSKANLSQILRDAIRRSEERGYHGTAGVDWTKLQARRAKYDLPYARHASTVPPTRRDSVASESSASSVGSTATNYGQPSRGFKLFVAGMGPDQTEQQIGRLCSSFGKPTAVVKPVRCKN
jgi:hypothetical protein